MKRETQREDESERNEGKANKMTRKRENKVAVGHFFFFFSL